MSDGDDFMSGMVAMMFVVILIGVAGALSCTGGRRDRCLELRQALQIAKQTDALSVLDQAGCREPGK